MALKVKALAMPYGVEFQDVYFKINRMSYNDENHELYFAGAFYLNEEARQNGLRPIENGVLCEVMKIEDKTVNLYEYIYNYIKQKAIEVGEMTDEEIAAHNKEIEAAGMAYNGPITDLININYKIFIDAEDC